MTNNTTAGSSMSTNESKSTADELYRIHCYADTLAKLCSVGGSAQAIKPESLAQIFKDIAAVTDDASALLYNAPVIHWDMGTDERAINVLVANPEPVSDKEQDLRPPFIKRRRVLGRETRIYVPHYVQTAGRDLMDILSDGVELPNEYDDHKAADFDLMLLAKDSYKEKYLLIPTLEKPLDNENIGDFRQRVGIKIIRECKQV